MNRNGDVYSWGHGTRGQLGHVSQDGNTLKTLSTPKIMDTLETKVRKNISLNFAIH